MTLHRNPLRNVFLRHRPFKAAVMFLFLFSPPDTLGQEILDLAVERAEIVFRPSDEFFPE